MTLVVLVIYGVFRLLKSFSKAKTPEDPYIKLLASTQIATGRWLHVVSLGSKAYFIGAAESGISLIAEVNDKELIDTLNLRAANAPQAPVNDFASIVQALLRPKDRRVRIADENPQADFIKRQRERLDKF
jgi:flagellar protein FliO/FliZ